MINIPTLTTTQLTMRVAKLTDFDALAAFRASDRARLVGGPNTRTEAWQQFHAIAGQWHLRGYGRWIVTETEHDAPLGVVGPHHRNEWPEPEIAWSMFAAGGGKGFAFEAALAALRFAYDLLCWATAISLVDPRNTRSAALATRMGCTPDGAFKHPVFGTMNIQRHPSPKALETGEAHV